MLLFHCHVFIFQCTVGLEDLTTFAADISDLFVKCFTQLSVQTSILATLLSLIHKSDPSFPALVLEKLVSRLLVALQQDEVQVAKLALRAVACLGSSNCVLLCSDNGGISSLLQTLSSIVESSWLQIDESSAAATASSSGSSRSSKPTHVLSHKGQVAAFLLASTVPWIAPALAGTAGEEKSGSEVLTHVRMVCERVCSDWKSPYEVGGQQAIFHVSIVHATDDSDDGLAGVAGVGPKGPIGAACWDSLWEACRIAVDVIDMSLAAAGSGTSFAVPSCMCVPWESLKEELHPVTLPALLVLGLTVNTDIQALADTGKIGAKSKLSAPDGSAIGVSSAQWLIPRFPVFDAETSTECAACATSLSQLEKYTIMGYYRDILQFFDPYLRDDGTKVGTVDLIIAHLQAVTKMIPDGAEKHLEYLLLETMFQVMLQQPTNMTGNSCYFRVILDITKKNPGFAPAVALGTGVLYNLLSEMDTCAARELARWLSYHLVNTKLSWPYWEHWAADCCGRNAEDQGVAVKMFCACVLDHCTRNALPERVRASVPEELHVFIPVVSSSSAPTATTPYCPLLSAPRSAEYDCSRLTSVAMRLREMVSRREAAEVVEEWLEDLDPATSGLALELEADQTVLAGTGDRSMAYSSDVWRAQLLLHVIIVVGNSEVSSTISALASLADRYALSLRTLALGEQTGGDATESADALVSTLSDSVGHEPGYLNLVLDILLRRGIVEPAAVARWATSRNALQDLTGARDSHWWHAHVEILVDRTLDIVRAATAHRRDLGGGMKIDEELFKPHPRDMSGQFSMVYPSKQDANATGDGHDERRRREDEEEEDEDEGGARRRRRGRDADEDMATDGTVTGGGDDEEEEEEEDPVTIATKAVLSALQNARAVYTTVVGRLLVGLLHREQQLLLEADGDQDRLAATDEWSTAAQSLLLRVLRSFHGAEAGYVHSDDDISVSAMTAVLSPANEVEAKVEDAERRGVLDPSATSSAPRAALNVWRDFIAITAAHARS